MLLAPQEGLASKKRMKPSRWQRFSRKLNPKTSFDPDSVGHWIKRVEKASEFAISNTYSATSAYLPGRLWQHAVDLETCEQAEYHNDVYEEAQELVSDWLNNKLKQELASDGEGENTAPSSVLDTHGHLKYDKFDDLCGYLEEEEESASVQKFIEHLLHKEVVDSKMMEELGMKENQGKRQQKDPRLTMEMRHKQVKENRLRREKQLEFQGMENALKKAAFLEAQCLVQEEKRRKAVQAKKEKEGIQREMIKLRREIIERRHTVEEAWKIEKKRQEENSQRNPEEKMTESAHIHQGEEKVEKERKRKLREILIRTFKENHQCQKRYFSAWHKLILDHRIKLGKAGTLSDWKLQLKVLRAWRDHTRSQKLERETQALENDLREENRKQQLATEFNRKQVLRYCFAEWQRWHASEVIKREVAVAKEQTRKKMEELLKAASLGKLSSNGSSGLHLLTEASAVVDLPVGSGEVSLMSPLWEKPPLESNGYTLNHSLGITTKGNSQGPLPNVSGSTPGPKQPPPPGAETSEQPGSHEKPGATSQVTEPVCVGHFHCHHVYQQQLIEKQRKKLEEQQKTIQKLKKNQRLAEARWAAERAAAGTEAQGCLQPKPRGAAEPQGTCQRLLKCEDRTDSRNSLSASKRTPMKPTAPHPFLKAMEERAIQRAERRRILAERKKKQEEDKLAQLKAQEEERQKKEAEEKEAQLERRREEKRLKKMKELEKQKRIKRNQELEAVAKDHYEKILLKKKGLEPWKKLRMQSKQNTEIAEEHHSLALQRKCLLSWFQCSQESLAMKTAKADQFYSQLLCRKVFQSWLQYINDLEKEVRKLFTHLLLKKVFRAWLTLVRELRIESQRKLETAGEHCDRKILSATLQTWKAFVKLSKEERVKEERRDQLRRKVTEILPDFQALAPL
ncbi:coiled-coil domain-containing protein 191 isoform X2 [Meriones unguiculatus]|uniref:coiled-coil domain-containing protein 191 isoform X2 n=1 Tax=Meriones unguiculatus TaxID=10047 RepID=UPI00293EA7F6|nr:coiled-coil domain-containing protein 191 isoform X2 [Meriones unguiculatus]